jgi:hypothetical protein
MVTKCKANLLLTNEKGEILFECNQKRRNKLIRIFIEKAIKEKWVLKRDLLFSVMSTVQSENVTEFLNLKEKLDKGDEQ